MPQTSAPHHSNLRPHGPLFSILSPQLHNETLLCPNPQTLTPGKWLWWKATQKPSSIYTLCFLTEHSQTVTCGIETTTGIFPLFIFFGGGVLPIFERFSSCLCSRKENDSEIMLLVLRLWSCVQKYIGDFRTDKCFIMFILQVSLSPQRCLVS